MKQAKEPARTRTAGKVILTPATGHKPTGKPTGRPLKFATPLDLLSKGLEYFEAMKEQQRPHTITGLALWLHTTRETLMDYQQQDDFFDVVKRLKLMVENYAEEQAFTARNPAGAIFALKQYGWKDKQEIDNTSGGKAIEGLVVVRHSEPIEAEVVEP